MKGKALRIGPVALAYAIGIAMTPFVLAGATAALIADPALRWAGPAALVGCGSLCALLALALVLRLRRVDAGAHGRARLFVGASLTLLRSVATIGGAVVLGLALQDEGFVALGASVQEVGTATALEATLSALETVAMAQGTWSAAQGLAWVVAGLWSVEWLITLSAWFLIPARTRRLFWNVFDVPVVAAFVVALWTLPFAPPEEGEDPTLAATALVISTLFGVRMFARLLPPVLDAIERLGFRPLVAARMLRAKKSAFLSAIGLLSILAVSFSSCTLTTTLSVMGGFREDLQRKILGNDAHVLIDRPYGTFEGADLLLERVRSLPGVLGASPYVAGEVMVTSASNLGGAVLRGIDPRRVGEVTDLPRNMRHGRLEYLLEPERLLHLSADEMTGSLLRDGRSREPPARAFDARDAASPDAGASSAEVPSAPGPGRTDDAPLGEPPSDGSHESLLREIDALLAEIDARQARRDGGVPAAGSTAAGAPGERPGAGSPDDDLFAQVPPPLRQPREVLPGLIVGQELARSLRLHVGDEVNVVSPLGDLGPAGPMPRSRPFRIAGIFYSGMYEYDMKIVYTDLATAQRFLSTGGGVTGIEVKIEDWEHAEAAAAAVREAIARPDLRVRSWQEVHRNLFGALELEKLAMFITLGIAMLVAGFCIIGTLVLMVEEKGREVGILKAMGADDRQIVGVFLLQGLMIGALGSLTGLGLGWLVCFAAEHYGLVHLDPEVYYIDRLPIHVELGDFVAVGVAAIVVCVLATIYPAILGSRLRPVDALRYS